MDALNSNHQCESQHTRRPAQADNPTDEPTFGVRSWVGLQMATWRTTGYVADSESEDEDIEVSLQHHNVARDAPDSGSHDGDEPVSEGIFLETNGSNVSNTSPAQDHPAETGEPTTYVNGVHVNRLDGDLQHLDQSALSDSRLEGEPNVSASTDLNMQDAGGLFSPLETTAQRLEAAINQGLSIVDDVLSPRSKFLQNTLDDLDSPLSTPPDSPIILSGQSLPPAEVALGSPVLVSTIHAATRNFRPRKAIQLNPYLLDFAKHQREWGERGLKPVHIPRASSPLLRPHGQEESQEFAAHDGSQASANLAQDSIDLDEVGSISMIDSFEAAEDDLPDLDNLLRQNTSNDRRRTKQTTKTRRSLDRTPRQSDIFDLPSDTESEHQERQSASRLRIIQQDSLPSPPRSTSISLFDHPLQNNSEPGLSPKQLTPAPSTGVRARRRHIIEDDSQSQAEVGGAHIAEPSSEEENDCTETEIQSNVESEVESQEVRVMQKRLRGVLPASCLTIAKAQRDINEKRREAARAAAAQSGPGPGVAQRQRSRTIHQAGQEKYNLHWYEDLVSQTDDSDAGVGAGTHEAEDPVVYDRSGNGLRNDLGTKAHLPESVEAEEFMDDDGVDRMLPTQSRARGVHTKQQTKSTNLGATGQRKRKQYPREHGAAGTVKSRKRIKRSVSKDILHVLDAPGLSPQATARPAWLRVAARQAKRAKAPGVAVSEKFIQLGSVEETAAIFEEAKRRTHISVSRRARRTEPISFPRIERDACDMAKSPRASVSKARRRQESPTQLPPLDGDVFTLPQDAPTNDSRRVEECSVRLTRLRAMLPLKNRAGQGRFIYQPSKPRSAQIEELKQSYRGISRHHLKHSSADVARQSHPVGPSKESSSTLSGSTAPARLDSSISPLRSPAHAPTRVSKKRRKQIPVHRPTLHRTELVPLAPDTEKLSALVGHSDANTRIILEREFVTHQAEWFQGRKDQVVCANQATQKHFGVFLEVLKSYLSAMLASPDQVQSMRELRSFSYRLVPNRGSIGAQGQVGDKTMDVLESDVLVARNVFDLHVVLLNMIPAYAPLPRVLETKVNFVDAHNEICLIALSAWRDICNHHHTQHFITDGLSQWLYIIMSQLVLRWKSAESDARSEAERSMQRIEEQIIRRVIDHNHAQATELMIVALDNLALGIEYAIDVAEAASLLDVSRFSDCMTGLTKLPILDSTIFSRILTVVSSYTKQWLSRTPDKITPLLSCLRQVITKLTLHEPTTSSKLQLSMIQALFSIAQIAIKQRQKSWDDFFVPTSSLSLDMYVSGELLDISKALFYHLLLENDVNAYLIDYRASVLNHWLRVLLLVRDDEAYVLLTRSVLSQEQDSLGIPQLAAIFHAPGLTVPASTIRDLLPEVRHATTMHVIAHLSGQQDSPEAEWLPGGLDESDAVRLLRTIFTTLKETWMSLSEQPEAQDVYTVLVHAALDCYDIHSRTDFVIEAWFYNSAMFPQRRKYSLAKLFSKLSVTDDEFLGDAAETMQQEISHARRLDQLDDLDEELRKILLPSTVDRTATTQTEDYTNTLSRHILFIQDVLPTFIKPADSGLDNTSSMLLAVLIHITSTIECRIPLPNETLIKTLTTALITVVSAISNSLTGMSARDRAKVYTLAHLTFELCVTTGDTLLDRFMKDITRICDFAAQDESREAMALIGGVIAWI